jgi:hypothetical protein
MKINLIFTLFICTPILFSQEKNIPPAKFNTRNSVQLDAGGHGMFYSLNYERIIFNGDRFKTTAQVGFAYYPPSWGYLELWMPIGINEIISLKNNHHIELGVGIVPIRSPSPGMEMYDSYSPWSRFLSARLGYRYQKPDGKFLFRAGFTPLAEGILRINGQFSNLSIYPLVGVSFGYSF